MSERSSINSLIEKYEKKTGKNAVWGGELTEQFRSWCKEQNEVGGSAADVLGKLDKVEDDSWSPAYIRTQVPGFDDLLEDGVPQGSNIIVSGGPGTGKTLFSLQTLTNKIQEGHDCVFLTLEESPPRLVAHMKEFGFFKFDSMEETDDEYILESNSGGKMALKMLEPIQIARSVEALLEKAAGRLPVDASVVLDLVPPGFDPDLIALDSISAMETAFSGSTRKYRIYIEQLFRYFEELGATSFLVTETTEAPKKVSKTGVEEFLTDGIIVFYHDPKPGGGRIRGVEVVKMRGADHKHKAAPIRISEEGLRVFPEKPDIRAHST